MSIILKILTLKLHSNYTHKKNQQLHNLINCVSADLNHTIYGGRGWIRTIEDEVDGFTVRCIWPLCNPSITALNVLVPRTGIEPVTQGFSVLCSTD